MPISRTEQEEQKSMSSILQRSRASRLEPLISKVNLRPFLRAQQVTDVSLYWAPVTGFPAPVAQREWLEQFLRRLADVLKNGYDLREEWFLQFKALYPHLLNRFTERANKYYPMTGMTLAPGTAPTATPTFEDVKKAVEENTRSGEPVDVNRWMPDHAHWFARKNPEEQRNDFFGYGGMFALYLKDDPQTRQRQFPELPRFMKSHEAYTPDLEQQFLLMNALQDGFLAKSKKLFGKPFENDPAYRGMLFILPLMTSRNFVDATADQRQIWFELFDAYFIESKPDAGIVLACKDPDFDERLAAILESMERDGLKYRY
jgi:hypothetical protein